MAVGDKIYIATKEYVEQLLDELNNKVDLAVIDTQSGSFVQSTIADDCVAEVTIEGKTVITVADPNRDISPDNPATIVSVGDSPFDVAATGDNLFDYTTAVAGIINADGTISTNSNWRYTPDYYYIVGDMEYTISQQYSVYFQMRLCFYDNNKNFLTSITFNESAKFSKTFIAPTGARYFRITWANIWDGNPIDRGAIKLELGNTATLYTPYKSNKITILSPIRSVPNGTRDLIEIFSNGKMRLTQKIQKLVLTGTENWRLSQTLNDTILFYASILTNAGGNSGSITKLCTHFKTTSVDDASDTEHLRNAASVSSQNLLIYINKSRLITQDVAGFKAWLAQQYANGTPVIVYYELIEPVITEFNVTSLITYKGTTNIYTTDPLQPNLVAKFYSRLGNFAEVIMARLDQLKQALLALGGTV